MPLILSTSSVPGDANWVDSASIFGGGSDTRIFWQQIPANEQLYFSAGDGFVDLDTPTAFLDDSGRTLLGLGGNAADVNASKTHIWLSCRRLPNRRTAFLKIENTDLTATYTVTISGTLVTYDAGAASVTSESDLYAGFLAAILAAVPPTITGELINSADPSQDPVYTGILVFPTTPTQGTFAELTIDAATPAENTAGPSSQTALIPYIEPNAFNVELWGQPVAGIQDVPSEAPYALTWNRIYGNPFDGPGGGPIDEPGGPIGPTLFNVDPTGLQLLLETSEIKRVMSLTGGADLPVGTPAQVKPLRWIYVGASVPPALP